MRHTGSRDCYLNGEKRSKSSAGCELDQRAALTFRVGSVSGLSLPLGQKRGSEVAGRGRPQMEREQL